MRTLAPIDIYDGYPIRQTGDDSEVIVKYSDNLGMFVISRLGSKAFFLYVADAAKSFAEANKTQVAFIYDGNPYVAFEDAGSDLYFYNEQENQKPLTGLPQVKSLMPTNGLSLPQYNVVTANNKFSATAAINNAHKMSTMLGCHLFLRYRGLITPINYRRSTHFAHQYLEIGLSLQRNSPARDPFPRPFCSTRIFEPS